MNKQTLKQQAYEMIKNNIINCIYAPNTVINEELIREQIEVSRTPIRDALSRLEQEGLVRILPKKGILITPITLREFDMVYETRCLLEPYVVRTYGNRISQETYLSYYRKYASFLDNPVQPYSYSEMDTTFHRMFIDSSENTYFSTMYTTIENQIQRTRILTGHTSAERLRQTTEEHLAIIKAALKNEWEDAGSAMQQHLKQSKNTYFNYLVEKELL